MPRLDLRDVTPTELVAYHALAARCDPTGYCWPSQATIADDCGMSVRQIRRALRGLESKGLIERSERYIGGSSSRSSDRIKLAAFPINPSPDKSVRTPGQICPHPPDKSVRVTRIIELEQDNPPYTPPTTDDSEPTADRRRRDSDFDGPEIAYQRTDENDREHAPRPAGSTIDQSPVSVVESPGDRPAEPAQDDIATLAGTPPPDPKPRTAESRAALADRAIAAWGERAKLANKRRPPQLPPFVVQRKSNEKLRRHIAEAIEASPEPFCDLPVEGWVDALFAAYRRSIFLEYLAPRKCRSLDWLMRREDRDGEYRAAMVLRGDYDDGPDSARRNTPEAVALWESIKTDVAQKLVSAVPDGDDRADDVWEYITERSEARGFVRLDDGSARLVIVPKAVGGGSVVGSSSLYKRIADLFDGWNPRMALPYFKSR